MEEQFQSARNICHILLDDLKQNKSVSSVDIQNVVQNPLLQNQYPNISFDDLIAQLESDLEVYSKQATELLDKNVKPWLNNKKAEIDWELWKRYKFYMKNKDGSFPVDNLDDLTDKILDKCIDPTTGGNWDRRGMVVGNVQSGKTANYTGLINKATDAGYKLIIVIAGIHNSLRSQTQERIDQGYIGRNSADFILRQRNVKIGVGKFSADTEIYSYTSSDSKGDFNRSIASRINVPIGGKSPTVLVIKKNKSILENLILWLNQFANEDDEGNWKIFNVPVLVIDDEADNASVNSGTELDVRTINRLIRTLLNLFNQNTFIGYTATPYANLYIPSQWSEELETMVKDQKFKVGEDLFPRDFIVNIPPPSNYIGAAQVFGFYNDKTGEGQDGMDIIRLIDDQEPYFPKKVNKENKDSLPEEVPGSLEIAIRAYILTCAIRILRGQKNNHNSMLIHVALRVAWIDRIAYLVNEILRDYKLQIKSGQGNLEDDLKYLFEKDYNPITKDIIETLPYKDPKIKLHSWKEVKAVLYEAVTKIEVRAVHGTKNTRSLEYHNIEELNYNNYENGLSVIAVGGNKLARGITLEGLSVSYYLRTTRMYDSLMQMGRWFGYRPGYVDLCRLYTTEELVNWYRHITMATEEMKSDFDEMAANNMRPEDYQLKVRTHSNQLVITSVGKMRDHEKIQLGYSGETKQTYVFDNDQNTVNLNFELLRNTVKRLKGGIKNETKEKIRSIVWKNISSEIVKDFLASYQNRSNYLRTDVMREYIGTQNRSGKLKNWSVALVLTTSDKVRTPKNEKMNELPTLNVSFELADGSQVSSGVPFRNLEGSMELAVRDSKNAILDKSSRILDLDISTSTKEDKIKELRKKSKTPLLVLMPIDPRISDKLNTATPVTGFGVIFPEFEDEEKFEYAARPLNDFDEEVQQDDDLENED